MNSCGLMGFLKSSKQSENSLKEIDAKRKDSLFLSINYNSLLSVVSLVLVLVSDCRSDVSPVNNSDSELLCRCFLILENICELLWFNAISQVF